MANAIDEVNLRTMRSRSAVEHYSTHDTLTAPERASLDAVAASARGKPLLDIGVGGGRTVKALREVSPDYMAVDYSPEMVAMCQRRFPDVRVVQADARKLDMLADASIFLAMFSCNGIGMVSHEDRLLIMREVFRVLKPGGVFLFSTHNIDSPAPTAGFIFPDFTWSANPARLGVRSLRFAKETFARLQNRKRFKRHEQRTPAYSIINDECHDYSTMLYYISLTEQRRQLQTVGFEADAVAYDKHGRVITGGTVDSSMSFVARKPG